MKYHISLVFFAALLIGCSHSVSVNRKSMTPLSDKLPAKVLLYLPDDVCEYSYDVPVTSTNCGGQKYSLSLGEELSWLLRSSFAATCQNVIITYTEPTKDDIISNGANFAVKPQLNNVSGDINFAGGISTMEYVSNFHTALTFTFLDKEGQSFYGFTLNGISKEVNEGSCGDGARGIGNAVSASLNTIQDSLRSRLATSEKLHEILR